MTHAYLIALGSNRRHARFGPPARILTAALARLEDAGMHLVAAAPILTTAPLGPSLRRYANSAVVVETLLDPSALLAALKRVEREFGRKPGGQRWTSRVLDLDIVLWSGGCHATRDLVVPHRLFRLRDFVLAPAAAIAPRWRDPITGLTLRHLHARLTRRKRLRR